MPDLAWITPPEQDYDDVTICEDCGGADGHHTEDCFAAPDPDDLVFGNEGLGIAPKSDPEEGAQE